MVAPMVKKLKLFCYVDEGDLEKNVNAWLKTDVAKHVDFGDIRYSTSVVQYQQDQIPQVQHNVIIPFLDTEP